MTAKMVFDPIQILLNVFNDLHKDLQVQIFWVTRLIQEENTYSATIFPDDGENPVIHIDVDTPVGAVVTLLGRELTEVATGGEYDDDDTEWQVAFKRIQDEYNRRCGELNIAGAQHIEYVGEEG